jgi:hypothetical protein
MIILATVGTILAWFLGISIIGAWWASSTTLRHSCIWLDQKSFNIVRNLIVLIKSCWVRAFVTPVMQLHLWGQLQNEVGRYASNSSQRIFRTVKNSETGFMPCLRPYILNCNAEIRVKLSWENTNEIGMEKTFLQLIPYTDCIIKINDALCNRFFNGIRTVIVSSTKSNLFLAPSASFINGVIKVRLKDDIR